MCSRKILSCCPFPVRLYLNDYFNYFFRFYFKQLLVGCIIIYIWIKKVACNSVALAKVSLSCLKLIW